ncbi:MAG: M20 metallopeptidase family protein [Caldicoprobacterales bacterium]|nr:amidohydrolase [Clostridiales bacterium]
MSCFIPHIDLEYMIRIRRQLHKYPELQFELPRTLELVRSELRNMDITFTEKYGKSSIAAYMNEDKPGFTIALRADMDALPITEINNVEYKSRIDGQMHACGHDVHTAALLGTIKALNAVKDKINCRLVFIFQASEEGPSGARLMVEDNVTDEFDLIIGCHVDNTLDVGSIMARSGVTLASSDYFRIDLYGTAGHAAAPHAAKDALQMGVKLYNELMGISREINPTIPNVLTVSILKAGEKPNIISDHCYLEGTVRTHSDEIAEYIRRRIVNLSEEIARQHGGRSNVELNIGYGTVISHPVIASELQRAARDAGVNVVLPESPPAMYAEDFAYYIKHKPGAFFFLGTRNIEKGFTAMTHNNDFDVDEKALEYAAKVFCQFIFNNMDGLTLE